MTNPPSVFAPPPVASQRPGLIGCGIVHLILGLGLLGMCALMLVGLAAAPDNAQMPRSMLVSVSLTYLGMAAVLATLGAGSIMARRWARALILILSWAWLFVGVITLVVMMFMLPKAFATLPQSQAGAQSAAMGCMAVFFGLFGIALPGAFILFYRRPAVRETVEALDPVPRWTDRHPLPLLGFAIWMIIGGALTALMSVTYKAVPVFGLMLRGWMGKAVIVFFALFMVWIGFASLRRMRLAWWAAIALIVIGAAWLFTFTTMGDPIATYEEMGMPVQPGQEEMIRSMYSGPFFFVWAGAVWVPYLALLLYIRRYFFSESPAV